MADKRTPQPHKHDDALAQFTDHLLDGDTLSSPTEEIDDLKETVQQLQRIFGQEQPDRMMSDRIRATLIEEWHQSELNAANTPTWQRWLKKLSGSRLTGRQQRTVFVLAGAAAGVALVSLVFLTKSDGTTSLPGAASGGNGPMIAFLIVGLVIMAGALWWGSKRS